MTQQRNLRLYSRPCTWTTGNFQSASQTLGALLHVVDAHPAAVADNFHVEAHAIVADVEQDPVATGLQVDGHFFGAGVANEVVQRLHRNAVDIGFDGTWEASHTVSAQLSFQSRAGFDGFEAGFQRRDQSMLLEQGRIQFQNQQAHFL